MRGGGEAPGRTAHKRAANGGAVMKRLLTWVLPAAIVVFLILQMTHTGPGDLWAGLAVGVFVLFGFLVGTGRLSVAGRR